MRNYGVENKQVKKALKETHTKWTALDLLRRLFAIKSETKDAQMIARAENRSGEYEEGYWQAIHDASELVQFFMMGDDSNKQVFDMLLETFDEVGIARQKAQETANEIRRRNTEAFLESIKDEPCLISHDGFLAEENCDIRCFDMD